MAGRVGEAAGALRGVLANPDLRRVQFAWGGWITADWVFVVALLVWAWGQGGAGAVALAGVARMLPAAVVAGSAAQLGDRYPRQRLLLVVLLTRAAGIAAAAAAVRAGNPAAIWALAVLDGVASALYRPVQAALLPSLVRTPRELVSANVGAVLVEGGAVLAGPALAGLLLQRTGVAVVFLAAGAILLVAALGVRRVGGTGVAPATNGPVGRRHGFGELLGRPGPRLIVGLFGAQTLVRGALNVLIVVMAVELLRLGEPGVGLLNAAVGVGGLVGAVAVLTVVRGRVAAWFGAGIALWGAPIALVALWPVPLVAAVLLAVVGVANSLVDVAGFTLLQRTVPDRVLARAMGALEGLMLAGIGLGGALAPVLLGRLPVRGVLVVTGLVLPVLALAARAGLARIDAAVAVPAGRLELIRSVPLFAPLPLVTAEQLAGRLAEVTTRPGEVVVAEGEPGDRFYIVEAGSVEVTVGGRRVAELGPGDWFGEIALVRDVPRTATVTATTELILAALERDDFVGAVTGHPVARALTDEAVSARLDDAG
jgi:MFS family permease